MRTLPEIVTPGADVAMHRRMRPLLGPFDKPMLHRIGGNTYEITVKGRDISVVLNGETTAVLRSGLPTEGPFSLQHGAGVIKFRKVAIKPL